MKTKIIAIAGPTASGKSALALRLAQKYGGEIVCCDSMQIYRGMDIGTAKPTVQERSLVPHHMLDFLDPGTKYSCADYAAAARQCIEDIASRGRLPVICGGTGLYLDSLLYDRPYTESAGESSIRGELEAFAEENGAHALWQRLYAADPESAAAIHENNVRRVARALEIFMLTGRKKSELDATAQKSIYDALILVLHTSDRSFQNEKIEKRADIMLKEGLLREAVDLRDMGALDPGGTASQAIGYKEIIGLADGSLTVAQARENLIVATRQYAKRQDTWFARTKGAVRLELSRETPDPFCEADRLCHDFLNNEN